MKKVICLLTASLQLFVTCAIAQNLSGNTRTITGIVKDAKTKQPLPFSNVLLVNSNNGSSADMSGKFKIDIPVDAEAPKLAVFYVGYQTDTITLSAAKNDYTIYLQSAGNILKQVVVTGVSKATEIKKDPAPIVAISPKQIEETSASNIVDALVKHAPGLTALKTGPNVSKPFIHGLGFNRVLTLYDGIREEEQQWGEEHGIEVDDYNIKRAEVIEGPSSLMYGSDALAGVMSLIPYTPDDTDKTIHGRLISEYQGNNGLIGNGLILSYGGPHWGYSLEGSYRMAKNYQNTIDGRVYNTGFKETNFTASLKHKSKKGYSTLNFNLYDDLQGIPDGSRDSLSRKFTKQVYEGDSDDVYTRPIVSNSELNSYNLSPLHQRIQNYRFYTKNHYEIGKGDINFNAALQHNIHREFAHPSDPGQAGLYVSLKTLDYGLRYNAPEFLNMNISAGVNGMYQTNRIKDATDFPIPNYNLFNIGGYVYGKWQYEQWTIGTGVRYDNRNEQNDNKFYTATDPATGFTKQVTGADTVGAYLQYPTFKYNFSGVSASFGTTVELNEHFNLKANIARGYRAPNINELASNGLAYGAHQHIQGNSSFKPEFSLQEDIGLGILYNSLSGSVNLYNNNIENYIYLAQLVDVNGSSIVDAQGNKAFGFLQSKAQIYGADASLSIHPVSMKGFSFDNSFSATYGYNLNPEYKSAGVNGEYLPEIPPLRWLSNISQKVELKSKRFTALTFKVGSEYNAAQGRYLALNGTETYTPGYTLFNAAVNATIKYSKKHSLNLTLGVNNIFDKAYQSNMSRLKYFEFYSASPNGHLGIYNMGRNIFARLTLPF